MKIVVFICGKDKEKGNTLGELAYCKDAQKTIDSIPYIPYCESVSDNVTDSDKVSHVIILPHSFSVKRIIPEYGVTEANKPNIKQFFSDLLTFLHRRFPKNETISDVTVITHWNFDGVQRMEDFVEKVRRELSTTEKEEGGFSEISSWKTFSYSSTMPGFFSDKYNLLDGQFEVPCPQECDQILKKLEDGYWMIKLDDESIRDIVGEQLKHIFYLIMARLNH